MHPSDVSSHSFDFYFPSLDTLVRVEESTSSVVIRATRPTFSEQRKLCFIRELAAEGFIPDECQWRGLSGPQTPHGVHWVVDLSWLRPGPASTARTWRFMLCLLGASALLWVALLGILLTHH